MKKTLKEELERIHTITYGQKVIEEGFLDRLFGKKDDPKKADVVSDDVSDFYKTLEKEIESNGLSQQEKGSYTFQKGVESMQIGLILLGYELPKYGVDGLFGPETASAVNKFKQDNDIEVGEDSPITVATSDMLTKLVENLKQKGVKSEDLKKYIDKTISIEGITDTNVYEKILEGLGAPVSPENMKFMLAWRQAEGSGGKYNPFNTTQKMSGAVTINSHGVKSYQTAEDGVIATIKTLKNGRYNCIVNGLINDIGAENIAKCESLKTWGTGDLVAKVVAGYDRGAEPKIRSLA